MKYHLRHRKKKVAIEIVATFRFPLRPPRYSRVGCDRWGRGRYGEGVKLEDEELGLPARGKRCNWDNFSSMCKSTAS
jgi:hypothetical protein